ncbi:hypothetical protein [Sulfurospirillum arsenophilum]|uniref:hypothetical protein n=1 Tax=Sulfurospirillum arsenophilum TaxID=56698 RepID=UPI0005A8526A|nr:hypothetical protein [Sulfurospirillum arsenophilum]
MSQKHSKCSEDVCKKKSKQFATMSIDLLCEQINLCEECNHGNFKHNFTAKNTYQILSILWAEEHNRRIGKRG